MSPRLSSYALSFSLLLGGCLQQNGETCQIDSDCESAFCCKVGSTAEARGVCAAPSDTSCLSTGGGTTDSGTTDAGTVGDVDAGESETPDAGESETSDAGASETPDAGDETIDAGESGDFDAGAAPDAGEGDAEDPDA